jgi:hypothetical protein
MAGAAELPFRLSLSTVLCLECAAGGGFALAPHSVPVRRVRVRGIAASIECSPGCGGGGATYMSLVLSDAALGCALSVRVSETVAALYAGAVGDGLAAGTELDVLGTLVACCPASTLAGARTTPSGSGAGSSAGSSAGSGAAVEVVAECVWRVRSRRASESLTAPGSLAESEACYTDPAWAQVRLALTLKQPLRFVLT